MSELLRLARGLALKVIESALSTGPVAFVADSVAAGAGAELPATSFERRKVLPPYLGELGLEVRYFLAAVEPWLRSGWRIPARRPALYPADTAYADPALFEEIDALIRDTGARPVACKLTFPGGTGGKWSFVAPELQEGKLRIQITNGNADDLNRLLCAAKLEMALKQILVRRGVLRCRPLTVWDGLLTAMADSNPVAAVVGVEPLVPSYLPAAFAEPQHSATPHVGVQLRALGDPRDSDVPRVMAAATAAAAHLGLPLLVYGHPAGTVQPAGHAATAVQAPADLLEYELTMLTQCRVMFAPNSGWFDLMCWLRVPTILEWRDQISAIGVSGMRVFRPRLALHDPSTSIEPQVDRLLAAAESLPDPKSEALLQGYFDWDSPWMTQAMQIFVNDGNYRPP